MVGRREGFSTQEPDSFWTADTVGPSIVVSHAQEMNCMRFEGASSMSFGDVVL